MSYFRSYVFSEEQRKREREERELQKKQEREDKGDFDFHCYYVELIDSIKF